MISTCGSDCTEDGDCPGPVDGDAVQRCEDVQLDPGIAGSGCVLFCGGGLECPAGMSCQTEDLLPDGDGNVLEICVAD